MNPNTKKWRAVPSTSHSSNPASVRMDIVDDGAEFSPAFVAGDIMPEDARLIVHAPELLSALEACLGPLQQEVNRSQHTGHATEAARAFIQANIVILKAKGITQ